MGFTIAAIEFDDGAKLTRDNNGEIMLGEICLGIYSEADAREFLFAVQLLLAPAQETSDD